jgi:hypothetical protein
VIKNPVRNQDPNVKSNRVPLLGFEFNGDTFYSNPDWNNFKIRSYISWSFLLISKIFQDEKKENLFRSSQSLCSRN